MKCNQPRPGFELVLPYPFPTTINITPRAPPSRFVWSVLTLRSQRIVCVFEYSNICLWGPSVLVCVSFLYVNLISLQFCLKHWHFFKTTWFLLPCIFSVFKAYCSEFSILTPWCLLFSACKITILSHPISFMFAPKLIHNWQETTNATLDCDLHSWMSYTDLVSIDYSFVGTMLLLVFVSEIQITRSFHDFSFTLAYSIIFSFAYNYSPFLES